MSNSRISVAGACLLLAGVLRAQTYSVQDLGSLSDLSGRTDSGTYAINASGAVAGVNVVNGAYQAMLYTGAWQDLGTLGGVESLAAGINDAGQLVGYSQTSGATTNGFVWTPGATDGVAGNPQMKGLGTLLGGTVSEAYAINIGGQITGYSEVPAHPASQQHAFVYSSGTMTDIGQLLTTLPNSYGYAINASGHVAGTAYNTSYTAPHAFFYNGVTAVDLGVFGGAGSSALAINNLDSIAGYLTTTSSFDHAFIYANGTASDLGTLGGHYSYALGINNSGAVVGGSFTDSKDSIYHAFTWSNGAMLDLNTLLDQTGANWTLVEARAINDAGQITGVGTFGGSNHAFRLSPSSTPSQPPTITSIQAVAADVVLGFTTMAARKYCVQTNGIVAGTGWGNLATNLLGNGGTLTITNFGAITGSDRFYRILLLPP